MHTLARALGQNRSAQAKSQRRVLRVHELQHGLCCRLRVAAFNVRQVRHKLPPELRVWFQNIRDLRGLSKVGCVGSGLNQGHLQPERLHLLRKGFVERFDCPFRGRIEADHWQCRHSTSPLETPRM